MPCVSPLSPIPSISVELVPSTEPLGLGQPVLTSSMDEDSPRPRHLLPPPVCPPVRFGGSEHVKQLPADKKGLLKGKVEDLLRISRERNTMSGKKSVDLRKEVAIKVHHAKQGKPCLKSWSVSLLIRLIEQRRATFLAKIRLVFLPMGYVSLLSHRFV